MQRVLVTGANRGIGLAFVRAFATRGDRVFAACRQPRAAADLADVARDADGVVQTLALDVTDERSIEAAVTTIANDGDGALDILVNNAGLSPRGEEFHNLDAGRMRSVFEVNTFAPMIVARHCHPLLLRSSHPRIVNISSSMGSLEKKDYGRHYSYSASKAALNMVTRAAAQDLADDGIVATVLHPGWVRTDLGGPKAALAPAESVAGMVRVIDGLSAGDSGAFLTWDGETHPW